MMYYEDDRPRRRRGRGHRRRHGVLRWLLGKLLRLLLLALLLLALAAGALYLAPTGLFMVETDEDLKPVDGLPTTPLNVLILGVDTEDNGAQRSDTILIASINRQGVKLTSIQRDTLVEIDGRTAKINAAYAYGGPVLAAQTVNRLLETNIMHYVVVDFRMVVELVDALGGIEMDITREEMEHINQNVLLSASEFARLGYTETPLTVYGEHIRLDGLRALAYARIRKLDSDFMRTSRQRRVIEAMLSRLRSQLANPVAVARFLKAAFGGIRTNLSVPALMALGEKAVFAGQVQQKRLPVDGSFTDNGSSLKLTDRNANIWAFRAFVYDR